MLKGRKTNKQILTLAHLYSCALSREELGRLRLILQRGIETVRLIGNHGMPAGLVLQLARVFAARGQSAISSASIIHEGHLQDRAALYWTTAVEMLERFAK